MRRGPGGSDGGDHGGACGAKVRLFEWRGCLGGVWTAGLLGYLLDFDKPGFARELLQSTGRAWACVAARADASATIPKA